MRRFAVVLGSLALVVAGACSAEGDEDLLVSSSSHALSMLNTAQVDQATLHANHGNTASTRTGTNAGDDGTGRVSWKQGGFSFDGANEISTCNYGWCGFPSIGSGCQGSEENYGYSYGACNSSAWGQRFGGYLVGVDRPAGTGDQVHADYEEGVTGTTTFGYHPYWGILYNGQCRIYQGWSYTTHSCSGTPYAVSSPSECGNGTCEADESCVTCRTDCGECPPAAPAACTFDFSTSNTSSAATNDSDTRKFDLVLQAGRTYEITTCDLGANDTYLRLNSSGTQVASNDDGCGAGYLSKISYTPSAAGTYVLDAGCYNDTGCGGPVKIAPGDETSCGAGGGGCTPDCTGDSCGQSDGCGGSCPSTDAATCGLCGNPACSNCGDGTCDAGEDCSSCPGDCGSCGGGGSCDGISYSASGTSAASCSDPETVQYDVDMVAGTTYTISTCDSTTTDTYLRLNLGGTDVAVNDDACAYQSSITYTATSTATYVVCLGCYSDSSCSATVSVTPDTACVEHTSGGDGGEMCTDTCSWPDDGYCDDGGPGSSYSVCALGTDCADCGPR